MERRKAVIAAATASLTLLAGAAAVSINAGLVGAAADDGPGQVSPVTDTPTTVYVDQPTTDPQASSAVPSAGSDDGDRYGDDDAADDGEHEGDRGEAVEHYEGADDDD